MYLRLLRRLHRSEKDFVFDPPSVRDASVQSHLDADEEVTVVSEAADARVDLK